MIKKDTRPVKQYYNHLALSYGDLPYPKQSVIKLRLLKEMVGAMRRLGRILINFHFEYNGFFEDYDCKRYNISADTVYVGKRKCRDPKVRRMFRRR